LPVFSSVCHRVPSKGTGAWDRVLHATEPCTLKDRGRRSWPWRTDQVQPRPPESPPLAHCETKVPPAKSFAELPGRTVFVGCTGNTSAPASAVSCTRSVWDTEACPAARVRVGWVARRRAGDITEADLARGTAGDAGAGGGVALLTLAGSAGSGQAGRATHVGIGTTTAVQTGRTAATTGSTTVAGTVITGISRTTNGRGGSSAATGVAQPLAVSGITNTLVGRRGISAKDGITELGTGTVAGEHETRK